MKSLWNPPSPHCHTATRTRVAPPALASPARPKKPRGMRPTRPTRPAERGSWAAEASGEIFFFVDFYQERNNKHWWFTEKIWYFSIITNWLGGLGIVTSKSISTPLQNHTTSIKILNMGFNMIQLYKIMGIWWDIWFKESTKTLAFRQRCGVFVSGSTKLKGTSVFGHR